jgi:hypothetical protein
VPVAFSGPVVTSVIIRDVWVVFSGEAIRVRGVLKTVLIAPTLPASIVVLFEKVTGENLVTGSPPREQDTDRIKVSSSAVNFPDNYSRFVW